MSAEIRLTVSAEEAETLRQALLFYSGNLSPRHAAERRRAGTLLERLRAAAQNSPLPLFTGSPDA